MTSMLRRVIRRVHADVAGVSLVEMLVAMGVFMLFSSMFVVSIVQFVRSNAMDGVRSQSASQINTVMQRVGSDATNAAGFWVTRDSSTSRNPVVVMLIPKAATGTSSASATDSSGMCVALTAAKNSDGDTVVIRRTKTAEASSTYADSGQVILTSVVPSSASGVFVGAPSAYGSSFTFTPEVGTRMYGRTVSSQASKTFYARNSALIASDPTAATAVCPVPAAPAL